MTLPPLPLTKGALLVDSSMLEDLMRCPTLFLYKDLRKRRLAAERPALDFGLACHAAWALRYHECKNQIPSPFFESSQKELLAKEFSERKIPEDDFRNLNWAIEVAVSRYNAHYGYEPWNLLEFPTHELAVEVPFIFPLFIHNGLHVLYMGKIDLLVEWDRHLYVIDHKTTSFFGDSFWNDKFMSPQLMGYCWAAWKLLSRIPEGYCVNAIRSKPAPVKPKGGLDAWWSDNYERQKRLVFEHDLLEWEHNTINLIKTALWFYEQGEFPQFRTSCQYKYGKCPFYEVCSAPPSIREQLLMNEGQYQLNDWSPLNH